MQGKLGSRAFTVVCTWSSSARVDHAWKFMSELEIKAALTSGPGSLDSTVHIVDLLVELSTRVCAASGGQAAGRSLGGMFVAAVHCDLGRWMFQGPRHQSGYCPCLALVYTMQCGQWRSGSWMIPWWYVCRRCLLQFGEMDVPRSPPPVWVLPLLGTGVRNAVSCVMPRFPRIVRVCTSGPGPVRV